MISERPNFKVQLFVAHLSVLMAWQRVIVCRDRPVSALHNILQQHIVVGI